MNPNAARDALLVFIGRVLFVGLWYVALLLVYTGLGQDEEGLAQAGLFAVSIACVKIISGCLIEPVDIALMRRGPTLLRDDPAAAFRLFRAAFWMRLVAVLAAAGLAFILLGALGPRFPGGPGLAALMPYILATVVGEMLFRSVLVVLQASERFIPYVMVEGVLQTARFVAIVALWALGGMELHNVIAGYAAAPFVAALCGALLVPRALFGSTATDRGAFAELLHFLKWMTPAMVLAAVNERLDVLMVYSFTGADAAGLYGAMITLAVAPDLLAGSLGSILQPRIVAMQAAGGYAAALRRYLAIALPACAVALGVAMLISEPVILRLLGPTYATGLPVFLWLLAGTLFWLAVTPMPMSLVAILAPQRVALVTMGQSVIVVGGGLLMLPAFGVIGMAQAVCAMRVAISLVLLALARRIDRRSSPRQGLWPATGAGAS